MRVIVARLRGKALAETCGLDDVECGIPDMDPRVYSERMYRTRGPTFEPGELN